MRRGPGCCFLRRHLRVAERWRHLVTMEEKARSRRVEATSWSTTREPQ